MTMKKRIKTAGALTLAAITVLSAAGLSSVYGALGVETDRKCSLTFTLDDTEFDELRDLEIPVVTPLPAGSGGSPRSVGRGDPHFLCGEAGAGAWKGHSVTKISLLFPV